MVLAGIGGRTVAEAKANLSCHEAGAWFAFYRQHGGLTHTDRLLATLATQINRLAGGEAEVGDFLPILNTHTHDDQEAGIGEVMNIIAMVAT